MLNGKLHIYRATGEGTHLQFIGEDSLPSAGEMITNYDEIYYVDIGDTIQFITRWGEPEDLIITQEIYNDLMRLLSKVDSGMAIRYLPKEGNMSWGYLQKTGEKRE
jgi:hypothetical protein